jgi:hypothetical protein
VTSSCTFIGVVTIRRRPLRNCQELSTASIEEAHALHGKGFEFDWYFDIPAPLQKEDGIACFDGQRGGSFASASLKKIELIVRSIYIGSRVFS